MKKSNKSCCLFEERSAVNSAGKDLCGGKSKEREWGSFKVFCALDPCSRLHTLYKAFSPALTTSPPVLNVVFLSPSLNCRMVVARQ